jgi:hypothetical protein
LGRRLRRQARRLAVLKQTDEQKVKQRPTRGE